MFITVAYDIGDDRRRTKVHKILKSYGEWTQFSLFECRLSEKDFVKLRLRLDKVLDPATDSVRFYFLCLCCEEKVEIMGKPLPSPLEDPLFAEWREKIAVNLSLHSKMLTLLTRQAFQLPHLRNWFAQAVKYLSGATLNYFDSKSFRASNPWNGISCYDSRKRTLKTTYSKAFRQRPSNWSASLSGIETMTEMEKRLTAKMASNWSASLSGIETPKTIPIGRQAIALPIGQLPSQGLKHLVVNRIGANGKLPIGQLPSQGLKRGLPSSGTEGRCTSNWSASLSGIETIPLSPIQKSIFTSNWSASLSGIETPVNLLWPHKSPPSNWSASLSGIETV